MKGGFKQTDKYNNHDQQFLQSLKHLGILFWTQHNIYSTFASYFADSDPSVLTGYRSLQLSDNVAGLRPKRLITLMKTCDEASTLTEEIRVQTDGLINRQVVRDLP